MHPDDGELDEAMRECMAACDECSKVCLQHIRHCLDLGGRHDDADHIAVLLTCASVCRSASELMAIGSEWHPTFCDLCAQVCEECAEHCAELGEMDDCVEACRNCAATCRAMVAEAIA
jgi:hypothetical protein